MAQAGDYNEYKLKVAKLNKSFFDWTAKQIIDNPLSIWKDGVQDYIDYNKKLSGRYAHCIPVVDKESNNDMFSNPAKRGYGESKGIEENTKRARGGATPNIDSNKNNSLQQGNDHPTTSTSGSTGGFSFGSLGSNNNINNKAAPVAPAISTNSNMGGFQFGALPGSATTTTATSDASVNKPFTFPSFPTTSAPAASSTITTSLSSAPFSFNPPSQSAAPAAAKPAPFSFNIPPPATSAAGGSASIPTFQFNVPNSSATAGPGFSSTAPAWSSSSMFGSTGGAGGITKDDGGGEDGDGEDAAEILEAETVLRDEQDPDNILHDVPCKMMRFDVDDKEWRDTGKGNFKVTENKETKKQRMLIRNPIGKISFNAAFYKGMKIEKVKNALKFSAFVTNNATKPEDIKTEMQMFLLKLKNTDVDATKQKIEEGIQSLA